MLRVEVRGRAEGDVELRLVRVGPAVGHRERAAVVVFRCRVTSVRDEMVIRGAAGKRTQRWFRGNSSSNDEPQKLSPPLPVPVGSPPCS